MVAAAALAVLALVCPAPAYELEAGAGVSYFVTDTVALNTGYRFQHISNGHTSQVRAS